MAKILVVDDDAANMRPLCDTMRDSYLASEPALASGDEVSAR